MVSAFLGPKEIRAADAKEKTGWGTPLYKRAATRIKPFGNYCSRTCPTFRRRRTLATRATTHNIILSAPPAGRRTYDARAEFCVAVGSLSAGVLLPRPAPTTTSWRGKH